MTQPFRHRIPAWVLTVAFTLTAQAADGVFEINQAIVEANGGFPYVISEPGSYILTGNLTVPDENTTAIEVQADHVTVDLNGFAIIGPVQCTAENGSVSCSTVGTGVGVRAQALTALIARLVGEPTNTVVRNGTIRGMGAEGVNITSGRVEGVRALENGENGIAVGDGIVRGCLAELNGVGGISLTTSTTSESVVEHSIALSHGVFGGINVRGGVVRGNASDSIFVRGSALLGNWIGTGLILGVSSGYADNVADGVAGFGFEDGFSQAQPIGCNLFDGNLVCPEGSAAQGASGP